MPIAPIPPIPPPSATSPSAGAGALGGTAAPGGDTFANAVGNALDSLQQVQGNAASAEAQAASGQGNLADTMIAASQASLETQVSTALVNKAVSAFNDIMSMSF
ncbi:MAG TPA: flagellar hook-basal body complex protein FliE [Acidimicrobiales bacterium]|nr:flagellar hook-basal body complex protein FliE [Acidimicrobiales bacterium]